VSAKPEVNLSADTSEDPIDPAFEQAQLKQMYEDWSSRKGDEVDLVGAVHTARAKYDPTELLWAVQGYLVMLVQESQPEKPTEAYRLSQVAIVDLVYKVDLVSKLKPDSSEEDLEDDLLVELLDEAQVAINKPPPKKFEFEDIIWKDSDSDYANMAHVARRLATIKLLLAQGGRPTTKIENNYARGIPLNYEFPGDVAVEFLPHWGDFYRVELERLQLPASAEELQRDIAAARLGREVFSQHVARHGRVYEGEDSF
jgi:hypothetical protein